MARPQLRAKAALIALFLIIVTYCSNAAGDTHFSIEGIFTDSSAGRVVSADLYRQKENTIIVSTLFPELAVKLENQSQDLSGVIHNAFSMMDPEEIEKSIQCMDYIMNEWMKSKQGKVTAGIFTGDLFEKAGEECLYRFRLKDMKMFFDEQLDIYPEEQVSDRLKNGLNEIYKEIFTTETADSDLNVNVRQYDEGLFHIISVTDQEETKLSIAVDNSSEEQIHALIGFKTDGRYYYREVRCRYNNSVVSIESALYSGKESSYRALSDRNNLFRESLSVIPEPDGSLSFQGRFESRVISEPLLITGKCRKGNAGYAELEIAAFPEGHSEQKIQISACIEELVRSVNFHDKKLIDIQNEHDHEELMKDYYTGITTLVTEIIPKLPADYQRMIINMIIR